MKIEKISNNDKQTIKDIEFLNRTTDKSETNYLFSCIVENKYYLLLLVAVPNEYNTTEIKCYIAEDENRNNRKWQAITIEKDDVEYLLSIAA